MNGKDDLLLFVIYLAEETNLKQSPWKEWWICLCRMSNSSLQVQVKFHRFFHYLWYFLYFSPHPHPRPGSDLSLNIQNSLSVSLSWHSSLSLLQYRSVPLHYDCLRIYVCFQFVCLLLPHKAVWKMKQVFQKFSHSKISLFREYFCKDYPTLIISHLNFFCHEKSTKAWFLGLNSLDSEIKVL